MTCSLAPLVYFVLPDSPLSARWLTDDEKRYLGAVSVNSGSGGAAHVPFRKKDFVDAVTDPKIWLCGLLGVGCNVPIYGCAFLPLLEYKTLTLRFSYSLPTVLVQLGYTAEIAQLMTVPLYAVGALFCITTAIISDKIGRRAPAVIIAYSLGTIGLIAEFALPKDRMATTRYGFLFFIPAGFYAGYPASLAWQGAYLSNGPSVVEQTLTCLQPTTPQVEARERCPPLWPSVLGISLLQSAPTFIWAERLHTTRRGTASPS